MILKEVSYAHKVALIWLILIFSSGHADMERIFFFPKMLINVIALD